MNRLRVIAFVFVSVCLFAAAEWMLYPVALVIHDRRLISERVVPGPQNQSAFFKSYSPEEALERFRFEGWGYGQSGAFGPNPEGDAVKHSAEFTPYFTMESCREIELMRALNEDIQRRFASSGTHVLRKDGRTDTGFTYDYESGVSRGSISVRAPAEADIQRNIRLPKGLEDITVKIKVEETWVRPASLQTPAAADSSIPAPCLRLNWQGPSHDHH